MEVLIEIFFKQCKLNTMYKITYSIFISCLCIFMNGCTKDADVKLPAVESKLVINSFISPQDTIVKAVVTISQPLYNNSNSGNYSIISNAAVQISDGVNTKTLTYNSTENYYSVHTSEFPITAGGSYHLTVTTPDGKNVNASTTIPSANSTLTFTSHLVNDPNQSDGYSIEAKWNDSPGTEDYYRIAYYGKEYYGNSDTSYSVFSDYFSDKDADGKVFDKSIKIYQSISAPGNSGELYLIHATKEYYLFHTKLAASGNSSDNPFAEPVQMFTNINGGFGVFAGFNQYKLPVFL